MLINLNTEYLAEAFPSPYRSDALAASKAALKLLIPPHRHLVLTDVPPQRGRMVGNPVRTQPEIINSIWTDALSI